VPCSFWRFTERNSWRSDGASSPPADGLLGSQTKRAIEAFQRDHALPVTGTLDQKTTERLGIEGPKTETATQSVEKKKISEGERLLQIIDKEGIGDRFVINIGGQELSAEEQMLGMMHQNMVTDWRIKIKPIGDNGKYKVEGGVPIAVDPRSGKMLMGLPLGKGTVFEILGKVKWFGQWIEPKSGSNPLFLVLGLKDDKIQIVHMAGDLVGQPKK
jgi:hypothetical protein